MHDKLDRLLSRAERLIDRIEAALPRGLASPDWAQSVAYRYRKRGAGQGALEPVRHQSPPLRQRMMSRGRHLGQRNAGILPRDHMTGVGDLHRRRVAATLDLPRAMDLEQLRME